MLTSTVENILNRGLPRSPRAQALCAELTGRRVRIEVSGFGRWVVEFDGRSVQVRRGEKAGDAQISGAPLSLLALTGPDAQAVIARGDVRIEGDAEIA